MWGVREDEEAARDATPEGGGGVGERGTDRAALGEHKVIGNFCRGARFIVTHQHLGGGVGQSPSSRK